jgi:hypothetical protein
MSRVPARALLGKTPRRRSGDETLLQTVPARHIYRAEDLRFGVCFKDFMRTDDDGPDWVVDASMFDAVIESSLHPS